MSDKEFGANEDLTLPKATIHKIIVEILGDKSGLAFNKEARDLLIDCSVEFVSLISSEANDIAERESKKTIATEHIEKALRDLGFPEYVQEVLAAAGEQKEQLKHRERRTKQFDNTGLTQEELLAQQQELFRSATDKYNSGPAEA